MTINKEHMELWIQALESDQHQQCTGVLRSQQAEVELLPTGEGHGCGLDTQPEMHCALGIGVLVALLNGVEEYDEHGESIWENSELPHCVMDFYGLESSDPEVTIDEMTNSIIDQNDEYKYTFWTIAQAMRTEFLKDEG